MVSGILPKAKSSRTTCKTVGEATGTSLLHRVISRVLSVLAATAPFFVLHAGGMVAELDPTSETWKGGGVTLAADTVYTVVKSGVISNATQGAGLAVPAGGTAALHIPAGVTLTVYGGAAAAQSGAYAGICVPSNSTFVVCGDGALNAIGGPAASGEAGLAGGNAHTAGYQGQLYTGVGGNGGLGGGGGAAGIGGNGGDASATPASGGGSAWVYGGEVPYDYSYTQMWCASGGNGSPGVDGKPGLDMGCVQVLGAISVSGAKGGSSCGEAAGGAQGENKMRNNSRWYYDEDDDATFRTFYWGAAGGAGGGGGGGGMPPSQGIGGGGGGGGAGGGGGGGSVYGTANEISSYATADGGSGGCGSSGGTRGTGTRTEHLSYSGSPCAGGSGGSGGAAGANGSDGSLFVSAYSTVTGDGGVRGATDTHELIRFRVLVDNGSDLAATNFTATLSMPYPDIPISSQLTDYARSKQYYLVGYYTRDGSETGDWGERTHNRMGRLISTDFRLRTIGDGATTLYARWAHVHPMLVTSAVDETDAFGRVSLREAVAYAVANPGALGPGGVANEIRFAPSLFETGDVQISLASELAVGGSFPADAPLSIAGPTNARLTLDGQGQHRIFNLTGDSASYRLKNLTIRNGSAAADGGAVYSAGALTIDACTFLTNKTTGTGHYGGAIFQGTKRLTITRSRFEGNGSGGNDGGALRVYGTGDPVLVTETSFVGNVAANGGAASLDGGLNRCVSLVNCSLLNNAAQASGGAFIVFGCDLLLANVTLRGNQASSGGGIYNCGSVDCRFVNVLCAGNTATDDADTADFYGYAASCRTVYASMIQYAGADFVTNAANGVRVYTRTRAKESDIFARPKNSKSFSTLFNGAVQTADPLNYDCMIPCDDGMFVYHDAEWTNVFCKMTSTGSTGYQLRGDALFAKTLLASDISGRAYPADQTRSMGSLWCCADPVSCEVTTLEDVADERDGRTSLREIVANLANDKGTWRADLLTPDGAYAIRFADGLYGSLVLKGSAHVVEKLGGVPVRIVGPTDRQITIDGNGCSRGFNVAAGNALEISDLTFANCCGTKNGSLDYDGGGIRNAGSLLATNVAFCGCTAGPTNAAPAGWGGAVSTLAGATSRLERCTFSGNVASHGGAVAVHDGGRLTVAGATFEGNGVLGTGSVTEARGNAAYVDGLTADALFAQCTFANNVGSSHTAPDGGAAIHVNNKDATSAKTVLANCVVVGNGTNDLATTGKMRLIGTTYGVKTAIGPATDVSETWYANTQEEATCTNEISCANVYAHTYPDGTPSVSVRTVGSVGHRVLPLVKTEEFRTSVFLKANANWSTVGWCATKGATPRLIRGSGSIAVKKAPYVTADQIGEDSGALASWAGAVIFREEKSEEDPPPVGPLPGAITNATFAAFKAAIDSARTLSSDEIAVFATEATSNTTITFSEPIELAASAKPYTLTVRGPLTLSGGNACRLFSVGGGVTLKLENITLAGGNATGCIDDDGGCGGAVYLWNEDAGTLAKIVATNCTFTGNTAYYGGAVAALGLGCAEEFADCTFPKGGNTAATITYYGDTYGGDGAAIYYDNAESGFTFTGGTIARTEIWPEPAFAVTTPLGATMLFGTASAPDPSDPSVGADDLGGPLAAANAFASSSGAGAKVIPLSTSAIAAKAADAGVAVAQVLAEMTPEVTEIKMTTTGGEDGEVSIAPENVVPFMTYSIEYASSPDALGTPAAKSGNKVQADASGKLGEPLTAPATGASGFYRVVAE